jgi:parallel beta helix pectate lyase-like protein
MSPSAAPLGARLLLVAALTAAGAAVPARAADLWVAGASPACSDARSAAQAASPATPLCTVARAAGVVHAGDVVRVRAGVYRGTVRPIGSGTVTAPIRFVAAEPGVVLDAAGAANAIKLIGVSDLVFDGFEVRGGAAQGIWADATARIVLTRLVVRANPGAGLTVKASSGLVVEQSQLRGNGRAGILELAGTTGARYAGNVVASNGADGDPYNGDGIQLGGSGATVAGNVITGNGDPGPFEHGVYTAPTSRGWTIEGNRIEGNAAANVKAAGGPGVVRGNRLRDGRYGIVLSDNPAVVNVEHNAIDGRAQHLVFLTAGATPARARLWSNTIDQTGRAGDAGDASAVFVNAAASLELRDNLVCYSNPDALGVALWVNDAARLGTLASDTNWLCGRDARDRPLAWNGSRTTLAGWRTAAAQDVHSFATAPPQFDDDLRVISSNVGALRGDNLGLVSDFSGVALPATGPVDIGAHQSLASGG